MITDKNERLTHTTQCTNCGMTNRVASYGLTQIPKCALCKTRLPEPWRKSMLRKIYFYPSRLLAIVLSPIESLVTMLRQPSNTQSPADGKTHGLPKGIRTILASVLLMGLIPGIFLVYYWISLPDRQMILDAEEGLQIVLVRSGNQLLEKAVHHNLRIPKSKIPDHLKQAFIAIEDRRFRYHPGVDPIGITTSIWRTLTNGKRLGGGSTITQQLAKNLFLSEKRQLKRKIKELVMAFKLEWYFTKDEILEMYLNNIYFGQGLYGVETASRKFFSKRSLKLNLFESGLLAAAVKAPNKYHIQRHPMLAKERAKLVLSQMVRSGFISEDEKKKAIKNGIQVGHRKWRDIEHRYFKDWILKDVKNHIGDLPGPFRAFTTLNTEYQTYAELSVKDAIRKYQQSKLVTEGALVAMTNEGAVRAMVGGQDFGESQFNRSTDAIRPPGSTLKPFIWLVALESGYKKDRIVCDKPVRIGGWSPKNYDGRYMGCMPLSKALALSRNTVAASLLEEVGRDKFLKRLEELGMHRKLPDDPSLALGTGDITPIELAALYATLSNGKRITMPFGLHGISDNYGNIIYWRSVNEQLIDPPISLTVHRDILEMLREVIQSGTGKAANSGVLGKGIWGKTGTSQAYRDAWFAGFTPKLVSVVWLGDDDNVSMHGVHGGGIPTRIWRRFMSSCHDSLY